MPWKLWEPFEGVSAEDLHDYIQDQVVARFDTSTERDDDLETLHIEGQLSTVLDRRALDVALGDETHLQLATWGPHNTDWTPDVDATTTTPDLGTGQDLFARVHEAGTMIRAQLRLAFGTTSSPGSGFYEVDLPFEAHASLHTTREAIIGKGLAYDASSPEWVPVYLVCVGAQLARFRIPGAADFVAHDTPWTWGDNFVLFDGSLEYERAEP